MKKIFFIALLTLIATTGHAQKRVNNHMYNPDPAPVVSGDRLYVFTGHDLDTATYFRMPDWQLFSTTDMEHWTDHGVVMSTANFKWAKQGDNAWASQAIERNGKWYWYVAAEDTTKHLHGIGVAVADRPEGPWTEPIGKPLIPGDWGFIDPTVFIDDDGQAWLFWGNNGCWYAKLNEDMISIDKSFANNGICDMRPMLDDEAQFGPKCMKMDYQLHKRVMKTGFEEAPWIYKIGDTYFLEYAAGGVPEHWAYSTAKSIHGPWHYEGRITDEAPGSFTIHGGTIDFKGKSYLFYHDGIPSGGNGFRRTTAFREFKRMKDGRIPKIDILQDSEAEDPRGIYKMITLTGKLGEVKAPYEQYKICTDSMTLMVSAQNAFFSITDNDHDVFHYTGEEPKSADDKSTLIYDSNAKHFTQKWWSRYQNHIHFPYNGWCIEKYESGQYSEAGKVFFDALTGAAQVDAANTLTGTWRIIGFVDELRDLKKGLPRMLEQYPKSKYFNSFIVFSPNSWTLLNSGGGAVEKVEYLNKKSCKVGNTTHQVKWLTKDRIAIDDVVDYRIDWMILERVTDGITPLSRIASQYLSRRSQQK